MRRRSWLIVSLLLLVAGGGYAIYQLTRPSPLLATTAVGSGTFNASLDEWTSRLYVFTFNSGQYILDTHTGALITPTDIAAQQDGGPVNRLVPDLITGSSDGLQVLIVDDRTRKLRHAVPVNVSNTVWFLDDATNTFYVVDQSGTISIIDVRTGRLIAQAPGCAPGSGNPVESHPINHLFLSCSNGRTEMHDARTGRLLRVIPTQKLGDCTCRRLADDRTGRIFLPGSKAMSVVDARTGAVLRTMPISTWDGGSFELDAHMGAVSDLDPRSGNVIVAPYHAPGSGPPARAVLLLNGRTGRVTHRWTVPANPLAVLVNPLTHHLLVASAGPVDSNDEPLGSGTLSVLDMGSGAILQQVEVGLVPGELFADRKAKRLLVVNRTLSLDGLQIIQSYGDGSWPRALRWMKHHLSWLPFSPPPAPLPPTQITVSLLDLARL